MKQLAELTFGFSDAENYRRRENKDLFSQIFLRTEALKEVKKRNIYFLIGEKGTGKTAYAVYMTNNYDDRIKSIHKFIRETDYRKFISLRESRHLLVSDYVDIWKCILLLMVCGSLIEDPERYNIKKNGNQFNKIKSIIEEYYRKAFSPEIVYGLQAIENIEHIISIAKKFNFLEGGYDYKKGKSVSKDTKEFQTSISELNRAFCESLSELKLTSDFCLFVDGIDIRPDNVPFTEYLDCVKGLANAAWNLNNDIFPSFRDANGRIRIILLLRPDIYNSLGLQNRNTKLKDNSIVLDWRTNYRLYRQSDLFQMADKFLSAQQDTFPPPGVSWDHYFPFNAKGFSSDAEELSSFILVLRYTYHRPRDVLAVFKTLETLYVKNGSNESNFNYNDLINPDFRKIYGEYLLGEIKDALSFYYNEHEYESFLKFFEYLNGKLRFSYDDFIDAFVSLGEFFSSQ